jgi:hypothetical protein
MNDNANPDHIGAASCRWFEETGEVSRPMKRSVDDLGPSMPIRSAQLLLTWHGDFGASEVITSGMDNVTITDLVNLVRQSPSVRTAWSSICETLLNLKTNLCASCHGFRVGDLHQAMVAEQITQTSCSRLDATIE